ncbi:oligomeric complex COG6 [Rhizoclosmatium globosum]|uniref:Conserved oligomeric Golgi complex subunit 6 n=1 Tax=Rhizoclosmatium globosum TaxID=329046 RepID=A0A1Y2BU64_9FUNG|nr:oligomeric complex COG6 [Rhizoclosmatium globosum]|eukprot:ORY38224.1 oligomeric complex COG6 [Rhizoclosmatium globosum]
MSATTAKLARTHPLSQKLQKILSHTETDANAVSPAPTTAAKAAAAHTLKADLDARAMQGYRRFLRSFDSILESVNSIESELEAVNLSYAEMDERLKAAKADSASLLAQTRELKQLRRGSEILTSSTAPLSDDYFVALNRLAKISDECNTHLMNENQKADNEIIESIAIYQEKAYTRLYTWILHSQLPSFKHETPDCPPVLRKAMAALKSRPSLFQSCMQEISQTRQETVVKCFTDALTRGGPGGLPRPIELHAHDPVRYVGDMLAWLHQASVGERELVEALFFGSASANGVTVTQDDVFSTLTMGGRSQEPESVYSILDKCMERTCRPLKSRIDEVLASHQQPQSHTNSQQPSNSTPNIGRVIGESSILCVELKGLHKKAFNVFLDILGAQGLRMSAFVQKPGRDLNPPPAVKEAVLQLRELMASYESSMMVQEDASTTAEGGETGFSKILSASLDPLLDMWLKVLPLLEDLKTQYTLRTSQIESQIQAIIQEQYETVLKQSGLSPLIEAMHENLGKVPLAFVPLLDPRAISTCMSNLDVYLCTAGFDAQARLAPLLSLQHQERALEGGFSAFMATYKQFHDAVMDPENKFEFPASILRPVGEIQTLLSV